MAAIAYPQPRPRHPRAGEGPALCLVPPPARHRRRSNRAVYRRRRLAALAAAVMTAVVVLGALRLGSGPLTAPAPAPAPASSDTTGGTYLVQPGDTLWAIARRIEPGGDVRALVARLAAERGGAPLRAGERITLPG